MRCSQPQGLSASAEEFLRNYAVTFNPCKHCKKHDGYKKKSIGKYGMLDELDLYEYILIDGSVAREYIQQEIWDSGPITWLGLTWKDAKFEWADSEMNNDDELADYGMSQEASYYEDIRIRNERMAIQVGDFVFCYGDGMAIFPVASIDREAGVAYLNPAVNDIGSGGHENLHKLTLVRDTEWAEKFPQFC